MMYQPGVLRAFLEQQGIRPKRSLSQNFLIDGNIIRKIIVTANVTADDVVLEIGSGPGALTEALLQAGATVIAVEMDKSLATELQRLQTHDNRLHVFEQDILRFPIDTLKEYLKGKTAKVIANLPYHVTTPILVQLVDRPDLFSSITVMVQEEFAQRMTAVPGSKQYGSFSIFLNFYGIPSYQFAVKASCFYPKPKVGSAIVTITLKKPPQVSDRSAFFILTRTAFEHRRKMLRGSLRALYPSANIEEALQQIGKSPEARPEELSLANFLELFHLLTKDKS